MRALAVVLSLTVAVSTAAQEPEKTPFTIDTMWEIQRVGTPAVSPDGLRWPIRSPPTTSRKQGQRRHLDRAHGGGVPRRLTTNPASDSGPVWSPDGRRLAFVSRRDADKAAQVYVIDVRGGEASGYRDAAGRWQRQVAARRRAPRVRVPRHCRPRVARGDGQGARGARENKVKARVTENRVYRFWDRWLTDQEFPHLFVVDIATRR